MNLKELNIKLPLKMSDGFETYDVWEADDTPFCQTYWNNILTDKLKGKAKSELIIYILNKYLPIEMASNGNGNGHKEDSLEAETPRRRGNPNWIKGMVSPNKK